ncbi:MAG: VWA domain-containing protein [Chloroflexi bacterium]|nr:VWA domain-containing protein [Chloroflexota bacterium]
MKSIGKRSTIWMLIILLIITSLSVSCTQKKSSSPLSGDKVIEASNAKETLKIVSGSENKILEPILNQFSKEKKINIVIDYKGSLDIMRLLEADVVEYDAVWPASSLWISVGDSRHRVKHMQSTSITPIVFGIRHSLAEQLGFIGRDVKVSEILQAIEKKQLKFTMTSATQSNSGASAYIGFIYALLGNPDIITSEDLDNPALKQDLTNLLSGVERSSGSSDWLKDLFLAGNFDAMVNYEALVISANQTLEKEKRETLYAIYPVDGLMIADSPLGFISQNGVKNRDEKSKEESFLELQKYLMSDKVQAEIQKTGRRTGYSGVDASNKNIFRADWGIDTNRILSTINMPKSDVLLKALNAYQSEFKKPGYNVYVLDFSGSMSGDGHEQLMAALEQVMKRDLAAKNFLQASDNEINRVILFNDSIIFDKTSKGSKEFEDVFGKIKKVFPQNGTALYTTTIKALNDLKSVDFSQYSPAILLLTDGKNNGIDSLRDLKRFYEDNGFSVPIFSILFGDADDQELEQIAEFSKARVFDGRKDLINAFKSVRGYN